MAKKKNKGLSEAQIREANRRHDAMYGYGNSSSYGTNLWQKQGKDAAWDTQAEHRADDYGLSSSLGKSRGRSGSLLKKENFRTEGAKTIDPTTVDIKPKNNKWNPDNPKRYTSATSDIAIRLKKRLGRL